jgi:hypothetical protein
MSDRSKSRKSWKLVFPVHFGVLLIDQLLDTVDKRFELIIAQNFQVVPDLDMEGPNDHRG